MSTSNLVCSLYLYPYLTYLIYFKESDQLRTIFYFYVVLVLLSISMNWLDFVWLEKY